MPYVCEKSLQLEKFKQLFPLNMNRQTRNSMKFLVRKCRTERNKNSSIPFMQTLLNKHFNQEQQTYKQLTASLFSPVCASELQSVSRLIADENLTYK